MAEFTDTETPSLESIDEQIAAIRVDTKLNDETKGEKLEPLYKVKAGLVDRQQEAERQERKREFDSEIERLSNEISPESKREMASAESQLVLVREWGASYEPNLSIAQEELLEIFPSERAFTNYVAKTTEAGVKWTGELQAKAVKFLFELGIQKRQR